MNWLAHLYLSEPSAEFRLGNLLPDFVDRSLLQGLSPEMMRGIACHRCIDLFTDTHPVVRQSIARLQPPHRRYGGIIMDIFYDHFLAARWTQFTPVPLHDFVHEVYVSFDKLRPIIPEEAFERLQLMSFSHLLCSYTSVEGVEVALNRLGARLRRPVPLGDAVSELRRDYEALQDDFAKFFPELQQHVRNIEYAP